VTGVEDRVVGRFILAQKNIHVPGDFSSHTHCSGKRKIYDEKSEPKAKMKETRDHIRERESHDDDVVCFYDDRCFGVVISSLDAMYVTETGQK
jgi:hypothetical protein